MYDPRPPGGLESVYLDFEKLFSPFLGTRILPKFSFSPPREVAFLRLGNGIPSCDVTGADTTTLESAIRRRFIGLSSVQPRSLRVLRISYGDFFDREALPIGPFGVPNRAFRDFGFSREICATVGLAMVVVEVSPTGDDACAGTTSRGFFLFSSSSVRSCSIDPAASPTCMSTPLSNSNSSPSPIISSSLQCVSPM